MELYEYNVAEWAATTAGAALLDEKMPGWHNHIDLEDLELESTHQCVLGQLFAEPQTMPYWKIEGYRNLEAYALDNFPQNLNDGRRYGAAQTCVANFRLGISMLGLSKPGAIDRTVAAYGFDAQIQHWGDEPDNRTGYLGLERAWADIIRTRQAANSDRA